MKVYEVVYSCYDEVTTKGIFSTRDKAQLYIESEGNDNYYIDECVIDEELKPLYAFEVKITEKTRKVEYCRIAKPKYGYFLDALNVGYFYYDRTAGRLPSFVLCVKASDKEKAEVIAMAHLDKILASDKYPDMRVVKYSNEKDADRCYDRAFGPLLVYGTGEDVSELLTTREFNGWYELPPSSKNDPWKELLKK